MAPLDLFPAAVGCGGKEKGMAAMKKKLKSATVVVARDDVSIMKHSALGLTPAGVKSGAKARAAARELFLECKSPEVTLTALLSGLPKPMVEKFCRNYAKR